MTVHKLDHELIRASAGTGKTHELTNRYVRLLRMGQRPDEILASTFTRKAAGEILGRVLLRLAQAATDNMHLDALQTALNDTSLTHDECLELLTQTVRRLHRLRIGTLDRFFAQLAGSYALEVGLPPGWRIAEAHEDAALRAEAIETMLDQENPSTLLPLVHALTRDETTRSLDREVREKIDTLYTVFRQSNRDAWHRMKRRRELTDTQLAEAIEALRDVELPVDKNWDKARNSDVASAEADDWAGFVKGGIAAKVAGGEDLYRSKPIEPAVTAAYQSLIDHAKAVLLNQVRRQTEATYQLLEKFHEFYELLKSQTRALRFDDITLQLAHHAPSVAGNGDQDQGAALTPERLAFRLDAQLLHLLLDEFQDTSLAQWSVLQPFARQITAAPKAAARKAKDVRPSFFCVGDTKQAIYGWRGGVAEIFSEVTNQLDNIQQRPLDTSWRSSPHVIDAVNEIFQNLHLHTNLDELAPAVTEWQKQFNEHATAPDKQTLNGYVCLQAARSAKDDEVDAQKDITLRFAAEQVAEWIRKAPGFEIGVLVRRNDAVRQLIYELRELGIEASEEGGSSLDDSAAVRLVLALMQLADHPADRVARFHVATSPLAASLDLFDNGDGIQDTESSPGVIKNYQPKGASPRLNGLKPQTNRGLAPSGSWVVGSFSSRQDLPHNGTALGIWFASKQGDVAAGRLARRVRRQLVDDGYGPTVYGLARQLAASCNRRELRRLEKLIEQAYLYDEAATSRPRDFVTYVNAAKVRDPTTADVRVMTVHQAKGLQFDIVVLTDLEAQLLGQRDDLVVGRPSPTQPIDRVCRYVNKDIQPLMPDEWQRLFCEAEARDIDESLCVLYVAVTRAVHAVHAIVAPSTGREQKLHKTFGGLLRAALTDGSRLEPKQIAYETGDPDWFKNPGVTRAPSAADVAVQAESLAPLEVKLAAPGARRSRGLQRVSPSSLEGGTRVRLAERFGESDTDRTAAKARGTLIHAWFELIHWLDDGLPGDDQFRAVAAGLPELALPPKVIENYLSEFHRMLDKPGIAACLQRSAYDKFSGATLKVETERPIAVRDGDRLLVGNIDRLVTVHDGNRPIAAEIIDFKTDVIEKVDDPMLNDKVTFYAPQLQAYCQAICKITGLVPGRISAKLLLLDAGRAMPIPMEPQE